MEASTSGDSLREEAVKQLKRKRDFQTHLVVYLAVNATLVGIWFVTGADGIFWPIFPILGWGIGLVANAWDVYGRRPITEEEIEREIQRQRGTR